MRNRILFFFGLNVIWFLSIFYRSLRNRGRGGGGGLEIHLHVGSCMIVFILALSKHMCSYVILLGLEMILQRNHIPLLRGIILYFIRGCEAM